MLEFVEAGTEQAANLGFGDDAYFTALERKVKEILSSLDELPNGERQAPTERLARLARTRARSVGATATFSRTSRESAGSRGRWSRPRRRRAVRGRS